ncbi:hypothetical protein [Helicobacter anatolicus]|uniref:hypothetical protein n=1 Tax=Helicobacter anatolicus TaxID=2905874 RepID=UPI001E5C0BC2|nr:hypothetical protein [Helicobacter anatolicus]MCE3036448.1 hypothetical protein [Helicobacter anatolicus]MCE3039765.1 hypothetical protein [Helicobacter anatolicus]
MCKIKCLFILLGVNLIGAGALYGYMGWSWYLLNYEMGFFGFFLVSIASYLGLKKRVENEVNAMQQENFKKQKYSKWILGIQVFTIWTRLLAYLLMIVGIFVLMFFEIFNLYVYLFGIFLSLINILFLQYLNLKKQ